MTTISKGFTGSKSFTGSKGFTGRITGFILALALIGALGSQARDAAAATNGEELVETSRFVAERLLADKEFFNLETYVKRAKGVLIIPELVKGGFIIGAEGGSGVLMVRGSDGSWSNPAFYTLAAGSIGLQIGGEVSEVVFTLMNEGAVNAILSNEFKLGADASVAVGPIGAGIEASATTNLDADIYAFSKSVGLFGGGALEGAKLFTRESWNTAYYGAGANPRDIVVHRKFHNVQSDKLRAALP